ncbi:hypothetical protein ACHHYP_03998 [Achlya hypogyna]|uniref:F-box domain-containing protein n=1 Tax=Achlya hypogyna TaxID=1202772 RepID=A0A1V9ZPH7_ACHHY|nr:hypothetical protein ACHHYP_03998 [Achlya hypogyna]
MEPAPQWHDVDALRRHVLSFLSPSEILRLSVLNRSFRTAAACVADIGLVASTPMNTDLDHIARFFRGARRLELAQCYLPMDHLQPLTTFALVQSVVLTDVVFLQDSHLLTLTCTARNLVSLSVTNCHLLSHVQLLGGQKLTYVAFERNMNLKTLEIRGANVDEAPVVRELRVVGSATFQHADELTQMLPALKTASFAECGMLSHFVLPSSHPSLESLDFRRCSVLLVVDVHAPHLRVLALKGALQLTHLGVASECLEKLDAAMLFHLQSVAVDCPALVTLNLTGCNRMESSNLRLHCPHLKRFKVHSTSSLSVGDYVNA